MKFSKLKKIIPIIILAVICFGVYEYVNAANYTPLAPIPGLTGEQALGVDSAKSSPGLSKYLSQLYTWVVAAASGLAVVMIMWGGVEYMTSAGGGGVEEAKKRISAAVLGLLLALGSYIILGTVNKDLLKLNFDLGTLNVQQNPYETFTSTFVDTGINPNQQMASSITQVDSDGYLVDGYGERIVDENNEMIYIGDYPEIARRSSTFDSNGRTTWGDPNATVGIISNSKQTWFSPQIDPRTGRPDDNGMNSFGQRATPFDPNNPNQVFSAASIYYPAGTRFDMIYEGQTYHGVVDQHNLVQYDKATKTGVPINRNLTVNNQIDIFTSETVRTAVNTYGTENQMIITSIPGR